jgi:shikimate kinase
MKERNIALIGFRATGKTTVGKILARQLNRIFLDMDEHLTASAGREIACWVKLEGWNSFRQAESELLKTLSTRGDMVVATGGGVILAPENRRLLKESFFPVWLKASAETIHSRIISDPQSLSTRPPLSELPLEHEIRKSLSERDPLYRETAEFEIDTEGKTLAGIALEIEATTASRLGLG